MRVWTFSSYLFRDVWDGNVLQCVCVPVYRTIGTVVGFPERKWSQQPCTMREKCQYRVCFPFQRRGSSSCDPLRLLVPSDHAEVDVRGVSAISRRPRSHIGWLTPIFKSCILTRRPNPLLFLDGKRLLNVCHTYMDTCANFQLD